MAAKNAVAKK